MNDHKTSITVRIRPFGFQDAVTQVMWPQDEAKSMGLDVIPGFVVDVGLTKGTIRTDIVKAMSESTPLLVDYWQREIKSSSFDNERAIVQILTNPLINGIRGSFFLTDIDNMLHFGKINEPIIAIQKVRDISAFCIAMHPEFEKQLVMLQKNALKCVNVTRLTHLTIKQLWNYLKDIGKTYLDFTGEKLPTIPVKQLLTVILYTLNQFYHNNSRLIDTKILLSFCVRFRPIMLSSTTSGSGLVLCGLGSDKFDHRGSYAPKVGLDYVEAGVMRLQPLEKIMQNNIVYKSLNHINNLCSKSPGNYFQISFVYTKDLFFVDTIKQILPNADMLLTGVATQIQKGIKPILIKKITQHHIRSLMYPKLKIKDNEKAIGHGIPAAPGACTGVVSTTIESAVRFHGEGLPIIFCAPSPTPDALRALSFSEGTIFRTGGITSHVAVIARGLGKPCVLAVDNLKFIQNHCCKIQIAQTIISEGQWISLDGFAGFIYLGRKEIERKHFNHPSPLVQLLDACDEHSLISVHVNADNAKEAIEGFSYGAKSIGLCRVEHMLATPDSYIKLIRALAIGLTVIDRSAEFFLKDIKAYIWPNSEAALKALQVCRHNIIQETTYNRFAESLNDLKTILKTEFKDLLTIAQSRPTTIRFLDPPLSEFLSESVIEELCRDNQITREEAEAAKKLLFVYGGILGLRGIRLGLVIPELTEIQAIALNEAVCDTMEEYDFTITVNIMAPFISDPIELQIFRMIVLRHLTKDSKKNQQKFNVGGMIETPRAALMAFEMAQVADFLSFGTNDLSQFVWASSRDNSDVGFLNRIPYTAMEYAPFTQFDERGVGSIIANAVKQAKRAKKLPIGVCGEHARYEKAIRFFSDIGIDYVSCSPFAVPEARLAAARVMMLNKDFGGV